MVGGKRRYSRNEMESLRFINLEDQSKIWNRISLGLGTIVGQHLHQMPDISVSNKSPHGHKKKNLDHPPQHTTRKKINASLILVEANKEHKFKEPILDEDFSPYTKDRNANQLHLPSEDHADGEDDYTIGEDDCNEDRESDDEYNSIQRPAFLVEGDPDFESGPPLDGLEYLRRVRWEAAQIPKVTVAKLDRSKLKNEQTVYMPNIPDITKCPQHLLPSKHWEDAFLADFSKLRLALPFQNFNNHQLRVPTKEDNSCCISTDPSVSVILGTDAVSRASMLRNHIRMLEPMTTLSRNVCAWIFALCATVDTPLDADTSASLRCLLRKCSELRSGKSTSDDEVVMLNILATICGKYFGQSEN